MRVNGHLHLLGHKSVKLFTFYVQKIADLPIGALSQALT
jgi:hypothetical protein